MVSNLNPLDQLKFHGDVVISHGQCDFKQYSKLRERNGWCFFSPTGS